MHARPSETDKQLDRQTDEHHVNSATIRSSECIARANEQTMRCNNCFCNIGRRQGNDWHGATETIESDTNCGVVSCRQPASFIVDHLTTGTVSIIDDRRLISVICYDFLKLKVTDYFAQTFRYVSFHALKYNYFRWTSTTEMCGRRHLGVRVRRFCVRVRTCL